MENDKPLKWKLKLTAELARGECVEYDVTGWERGEAVTLGSLGLSIAEGKAILAEIQTRMVAAQIECHGEARRCCGGCGRPLKTGALARNALILRDKAGIQPGFSAHKHWCW